MRSIIIATGICVVSLCGPVAAQVRLEIGVPSVRIGIDVPVYPTLAPVPGYPVYYAPQADANLFFYDGLYWVYAQDRWYSSAWYNGPWITAASNAVPLFVLRVPVGYYRRPPAYFVGWSLSAPPRWDEHWGRSWAEHHVGWDHWDRRSSPAPAPLPSYQRAYSGSRYPMVDQQQVLRNQNYHYQPREALARRQFEQSAGRGADIAARVRAEHDSHSAPLNEPQRSRSPQPIPARNSVARNLSDGPA
jgi:hypothetical protein